MKIVIALWGRGDVGKSQTIRQAFDLLRRQYPAAQFVGRVGEKEVTGILNVDGFKIGIETHGDNRSILEPSLRRFVQEDCRVIICATRTRGGTADVVNELENDDYIIEWKCQVVSDESNQNRTNRATAEDIVALVVTRLGS